ncbi:MAG: hypothetical protein AB7F43_11690 [Bacteriovoracia bacterium]
MGRNNRNGSVQKKRLKKQFPEVIVDQLADFASIKLAPGVEAKSYLKDGFIFCEDKKGHIIEIQVLNLSQLKKRKSAA